MQPIYLDIGNSSFKLAEHHSSGWNILFREPLKHSDQLFQFIEKLDPGRELVIASVRKEAERQLAERITGRTIRRLKVSQVPPEYLNYNTPETLGMDRFLSCLGAFSLSGRPVIVIDAGSACTVDYMTRGRMFQGGVIMPGLSIFELVMARSLPELPVVEAELPENWPGKSTEECIRWGLYGGFLSAIEAFIRKYQTENEEADVYITGGDAVLIKKLLEGNIKINYSEHLLFEGMKEFLEIV
jgi:type III pantothenate kinase